MTLATAQRFAETVLEQNCHEKEFDLSFASEREMELVSKAVEQLGHRVQRDEKVLRLTVICQT